MENNLSIAIVDCDSLCYLAFHPNKVLDEFGNPKRTEDNSKFLYYDKTEDEIRKSCDNVMKMILDNSKATHYLAFIKGKDTIREKLAVDPTYKQDRASEKPKMWDFTKQYFIDAWQATEVDNIEVDDAVNIARLQIPNSFICAIDSDLLGLEGTHYNWKKGEWITITESQANLKFWSDMITGTHNNTKGIPNKGIKYVDKLILKNTLLNNGFVLNYLKYQVLDEYMNYYGEEIGIKEFYKNYICTHIKDSYSDIEFKTPIDVKTIYAKTTNLADETQFPSEW